MHKDLIISKGKYRLPQLGGMVSVKQYVLTRDEAGKKSLLLRFYNDRNEMCTGFTFILYCQDARGKVVEKQTLEAKDIEFRGGSLYVYNDAITVHEKCVNFTIVVKSASYGNYTYNNDGDSVAIDYKEADKHGIGDYSYYDSTRTRKVTDRAFKLSWLYVTLALLILMSAVAIIGWQLKKFRETEMEFSLSGVNYELVADNPMRDSVIITGCSTLYTNIVIPDEIEGYKVVGIKDGAFRGNQVLQKIHIDGVNIGNETFKNCTNLKEVRIDGATSVGKRAFQGCSSLTTVNISNDKEKEILTIGDGAFSSCKSLTTVSINQFAVYEKSSKIFEGSTYVVNLYLKNFAYALPNYDISVEQEKKISELFDSKSLKIESLSIDYMDEAIPDSFCSGLDKLTSVSINKTEIKSIGEYAFNNCSRLETVSLKSPVTSLGTKSFAGTSISFFDCSKLDKIEEKSFYDCAKLSEINLSKNKALKAIGKEAFAYCTALNIIDLPATIESIGAEAFVNSGIKSFNVNSEKISISMGALEGCQSLSQITLPYLPNGSIGYLFGCSEFELPEDYSDKIPESLTEIHITGSISEIGYCAFAGCTGLTDITVDGEITSIGDYAFYDCMSLKLVPMSDSIAVIGDYAFSRTAIESIELPVSIKSVSIGAFESCTSLKEVILPEGITEIHDNAFYDCSSLTSIDLHKVEMIQKNAFAQTGLKSIVIPVSATQINAGILANCHDIEEITISLSNLSVFDYFYNYEISGSIPTSLKRITVNQGEHINEYAFDGCTSVEEIIFEESVRSIGPMAIANCYQLRRLVLPASLEHFDYEAVSFCYRLYEVCNQSSMIDYRTESSNASYAISICTSKDQLAPIVEYDGYTFARYNDNWYLINWDKTKSELSPVGSFEYMDGEAPVTVNGWYVANNLFYEDNTVESVTFPSTLMGICNDAFRSSYSLEKVIFDNIDAEITIAPYSFNGCYNLRNVELSGNIIAIDEYAFAYCQNIKSVKLPTALTSIGAYAFYECMNLESIKLYSDVISIGECAFLYCNRLYDVYNISTLPITAGSKEHGYVARNAVVVHESMSEELSEEIIIDQIGTFRRYGNKWLLLSYNGYESDIDTTQITYNGMPLQSLRIYANAFAYASNLKSLYIGENVRQIQENAFYKCSNLKYVTFNNSSITEIEDYTFYECDKMIELTLPYNIKTIGDCAFMYCTKLLSIKLPASIELIGSDAFYGCDELFEVYNLSSNITVDKNTSNGFVGYNAKAIFTSEYDGPLQRYEENGCYFIHYDGKWYLHHYTGDNVSLLVIPSVGDNCAILSSVFSDTSITRFIIPENVTSISTDTGNRASFSYIYYEGTMSQWNNVNGAYYLYSTVRYYDECVHNSYSWTYENGALSTDYCELIWTEEPATCIKEGRRTGVCACGCEYTEVEIIGITEHVIYDNECIYCGLKVIQVTKQVYNEYINSGVFEPDSFSMDDTNTIKSVNTLSGSTANFSIIAKEKMVITFTYGLYSEDYYDYLYIYKNGYSMDSIYSSYAETMTITLYEGDELLISFFKNDYSYQSDDYAYIENMQIQIDG